MRYHTSHMHEELFKPTHLRQLCELYHLQPSKEYGQNYLLNPVPIAAIIEAGDVGASDIVVEVGPGFGVLTLALAPKVKKVIAFEIEKKLQLYWESLQLEYPNIDIHWGNVLYEFPTVEKALPSEYIVAANVPYQITALILRLFLEAKKKPKTMVVMVQKEVAERICAKPGDMSLLSLSVQYYGKPRIAAKVSKGNFWPQPKVDSAVVAIRDIQEREGSAHFFDLARAGFANKRKQLWRNLSDGMKLPGDAVKAVLRDVCGNEQVRAQELSVAQWEKLAGRL